MREPTKLKVTQMGEGWVEVLWGSKDEIFITVARQGDSADDERVIILTPRQALKVAGAIVRFVRSGLR